MTGTPGPLGTGLRESPRPLTEAYDTAVFDLDGVVYIAGESVGDSPRHIAAARATGMRVAYVTNNASRTPEEVAQRLRRIGVDCADGDVVTSAQAAARLVARRVPAGSRVLVVGGGGLLAALDEHGLVPVARFDEGPAAVVQGFHPDVGWRLLAEGAAAVNAGLPWIASNTDLTVPTAYGRSPGNGTLVEVIARTTGASPEVAGKPQPPLFEETMLRVGGQRPLVVGDRLDTDIEGAVRCGLDSLLVLTGVTDVATLATAATGLRPSFVAADLRGLFVPHARPRVDAAQATCGGWTARVESTGGDSHPALSGHGDPTDALRALVSLCWARADCDGAGWTADVVDTAWQAAGLAL
ncbi:MAG: HAD-IIA family hydrolase [Actinomycetota bacterium]|nr:HAD-IIA family hydrolase [Actinomycetota bacterium]